MIEQWGHGVTSGNWDINVSLFVTFDTTDYCILASYGYTNDPGRVGYKKDLITKNSFRIAADGNGIPLSWKVEGY